MDEVRMVRDLYPEPASPSAQQLAQEIAQVKARLTESPRRSLPRIRWGIGGLGGLVAVGAAAAVAITLVGGNGDSTTVVPPGQVNLDAKSAVLAAAQKAEQQPGGKYWYTNVIQGQAYILRPKTGTYAIDGALTESFSWFGAKTGMGEGYAGRDLPAHLKTEQDRALWRKAGSPSRFPVWSGDKALTFSSKEKKWELEGPEKGTYPRGGGKFLDGKHSVEDLQNLPTDPAKLAKMFLGPGGMLGRAAKADPSGTKRFNPVNARTQISMVMSVLGMNPVPQKVRAGLMRALADQPGIHAIGRTTDPLGREGIALASDDFATTATGEWGGPKAEQGTYRSREVIIFDEKTGDVLSRQDVLTKPGGKYSQMKPGFIIEYWTVRSAKWTDTKPVPPAALPWS
ncbi:CU044_5270 family protein [Spirillospora sp. NPDC048911]|uniref:CU044_5270 family protein n=1 Tax=Spirillospora sp. NPDC048911 TaxID=3364527 RepID=UPI00371AAA04